MDSKIVRAAQRQRKLTLNQIDRNRNSTTKKLPTNTQYHHNSFSKSATIKIGKPHRHQRSIKIIDEDGYEDEDNCAGVDSHEDFSKSSVEESNLCKSDNSLNEKVPPSAAILSLADVMVEKPKRKQFLDSFELISKPISRVIVLPDECEVDQDQLKEEQEQESFPSLTKFIKKENPNTKEGEEKGILDEESWERIGKDGEKIKDNNTNNHYEQSSQEVIKTSTDENKCKNNWINAVLNKQSGC